MHGLSGAKILVLAAGIAVAALAGCASYPLAPMTTAMTASRTRTGSIRMVFSPGSRAIAALRHVAYTRGDIATMQTTLTGTNLTTPLVQSIPYGTSTGIEYDSLAPGSYGLLIQALDGNGEVIGQVQQTAIGVQADQTTQVDLTLQLNPDGTIGSSNPDPSTPTASGSTGNLEVGVAILDNTLIPGNQTGY